MKNKLHKNNIPCHPERSEGSLEKEMFRQAQYDKQPCYSGASRPVKSREVIK